MHFVRVEKQVDISTGVGMYNQQYLLSSEAALEVNPRFQTRSVGERNQYTKGGQKAAANHMKFAAYLRNHWANAGIEPSKSTVPRRLHLMGFESRIHQSEVSFKRSSAETLVEK